MSSKSFSTETNEVNSKMANQDIAEDVKVDDIQDSNEPKETVTAEPSDPSDAADDSAPARPQFEIRVPEESELYNDPTFLAAAQLDKSKISATKPLNVSFETILFFKNQITAYFNFQVELRDDLNGLKVFQSPPIIQAVYMLASYLPPLTQPVLFKFMKDRFDLYNNSGCTKMALLYMTMLQMYRDAKYTQCIAQDMSYLAIKRGELENNEEEFAKVEGSYYFYAKESTEWQSERFIPNMVNEQLEKLEDQENQENTE